MKKSRKWYAIFAITGVLGMVLTGCGASGGRPTVNLNDYIVVEVEGYDGRGSFNDAHVDYVALAEKYGDRAENGEAWDDGYHYVFDEEKYPDCEVSVRKGGQPLYYYIISVE